LSRHDCDDHAEWEHEESQRPVSHRAKNMRRPE
jgi:hypothetical protein